MPLDYQRLQRSDWWITACIEAPAAAAAAVNLWGAAWQQVPAGSLPNSDALLMRYSMLDQTAWRKVRARVLQQWIECEDGRLYHPVVAEKALHQLSRKRPPIDSESDKFIRQKRWRQRLKDIAAQCRAHGLSPSPRASLQELQELLHSVGAIETVDAQASTKASTEPSTKASTPRLQETISVDVENDNRNASTETSTKASTEPSTDENQKQRASAPFPKPREGSEPKPDAVDARGPAVATEVLRRAGMTTPPRDMHLAADWLRAGADPDGHIYPTVDRLTLAKRGKTIGSFQYFDSAVREATTAADRDAEAYRVDLERRTAEYAEDPDYLARQRLIAERGEIALADLPY